MVFLNTSKIVMVPIQKNPNLNVLFGWAFLARNRFKHKLIPLLCVWLRLLVTDHNVNGYMAKHNADTTRLSALSDPLT